MAQQGPSSPPARTHLELGDQPVDRGAGGETHQVAGGNVPVLTTAQGVPVSDDQNSLHIGKRGPIGLRLASLPQAAPAARPVKRDLPPSSALSILQNGPKDFRGRRLGVLITDGTDATLLTAPRTAFEEEGATVKLIASQVGGIQASDGIAIVADERLDGAPSVLFDAVAVLASEQVCGLLLNESTARDFVADAFAHLKIIGYVPSALPLLEHAGIRRAEGTAGIVELGAKDAVLSFLHVCRALRVWERARELKRF